MRNQPRPPSSEMGEHAFLDECQHMHYLVFAWLVAATHLLRCSVLSMAMMQCSSDTCVLHGSGAQWKACSVKKLQCVRIYCKVVCRACTAKICKRAQPSHRAWHHHWWWWHWRFVAMCFEFLTRATQNCYGLRQCSSFTHTAFAVYGVGCDCVCLCFAFHRSLVGIGAVRAMWGWYVQRIRHNVNKN